MTDSPYSNCISFWHVAHTSADTSTRRASAIFLDKQKYADYVAAQGDVVQKWEMKGMWIHNPFGDDNTWPMDWDARAETLEAEKIDARLKAIDDSFLPSMRKYLRRNIGDLWLYLGSCHNVPSMIALEQNARAWKARWETSVYPVLKLHEEFGGRVHLACDRTTDLPAEHPHYFGLRQLQSLGVDVIGEPRPKLGFDHLYGFGSVWMLDLWGNDRMNPDQFPDAAKLYARDSDIRGGKYCLWVHNREPNAGTRLEAAERAIARGWTPVINMTGIK